MFRRLISAVMALTLVLLSGVLFFGCDAAGEDGNADTQKAKLESVKRGTTKNSLYIIKAEDFEEFKEAALGGSWKRMSYKVPVVSEMNTVDTYYLIGHAVGQTKDGSDIEFEHGRLQIIGRDVYSGNGLVSTYNAIDHISFGGFAADETEVELERDTMYGDNSYNVNVNAKGKKTDCFIYVEIRVKKEMKLCANYVLYEPSVKNSAGERYLGETDAKVYYPQQIQLSDLKFQYLESKDYVDGRYNKSALKDTIDMEIGKTYYLVVSVKIKSALKVADGETVIFNARIPHLSLVSGTLDSADSGNYTETVDSGSKTMEVEFRIPDPEAGEKEYEFIYKLTPVTENGYPTMYFEFYTNAEISIMGGSNEADIKLPFGMEQAAG